MAEISTNIILDGITLCLREVYPDRLIASDAVEQGFLAPAFIVTLVSGERKPALGRRVRLRADFEVRSFPALGREECYETADALFSALGRIRLKTGDELWGTDMSFKVEDGILHFFVSYACFAFPGEDDGELMEKMESRVRLSFDGRA
ncbi:MAG: hypothetical protein II705_08525 [Clostridia bacterium]|nr:hypothetical protein [Clostridia bacterium]